MTDRRRKQAARPVARAERDDCSGGSAAPAAALIFQIFHQPGQRPFLDPGYVPFDNGGRRHPCYEFDVFERLATRPEVQAAQLWGALSWRFREKTGLTGQALFAALRARPEYDLYFINPQPWNEAVFHNGWRQGAAAHPRFMEAATAFLYAAGLSTASLDEFSPGQRFSTANFFVGSKRFWKPYLAFVRGALDRALANLDPAMLALVSSQAADPDGIHGGATYLPFIIERLLPVFLDAQGQDIKVCKMDPVQASQPADVHLLMLRDLKNNAVAQRSPWLAACWSNYRALYLTQRHGRSWAAAHLRAITPNIISFPR